MFPNHKKVLLSKSSAPESIGVHLWTIDICHTNHTIIVQITHNMNIIIPISMYQVTDGTKCNIDLVKHCIFRKWTISLLVIAERWARSSTSMATCTRSPSNCDMQGGTGASYNMQQRSKDKLLKKLSDRRVREKT